MSKKIAVIGSGTMGIGIAQTFASFANEVVLYDTNQAAIDKALAKMAKGLDKLIEKGKIVADFKQEIISHISATSNLEDLINCQLIIEAIPEKMELKKDLFAKLDTLCVAETIFATNTSSLSVTEIASATKRPDKVIGMHFFNPAPVMKLVEVIRGIATSNDTFGFIQQLIIDVEKQPVEVQEAPGFVVNRILIPMINEAVGILAENIASAADIDTAMKLGANHPMGPLELADFIGNDVNLAIMECLYEETGDVKYRPHPHLRKMVRAGYLGRKTKQGFYKYE